MNVRGLQNKGVTPRAENLCVRVVSAVKKGADTDVGALRTER